MLSNGQLPAARHVGHNCCKVWGSRTRILLNNYSNSSPLRPGPGRRCVLPDLLVLAIAVLFVMKLRRHNRRGVSASGEGMGYRQC